MNPDPFKNDDAALQVMPANASQTVDNYEISWASMRKPQTEKDQLLAAPTFSWLVSLPVAIRPMQLSWQFPRIANQLADIWIWPGDCEKYLEELLKGSRNARKGFPEEISNEIIALKHYFGEVVSHH